MTRTPSRRPRAAATAAVALLLTAACAAGGAARAQAQQSASAQPPARQSANPVTLTIEQARTLAHSANASGQFDLALGVANGLLQRDPEDAGALIEAASALIGLGRYDEAVRMAARAFRAAGVPGTRVQAARLAASAQYRAHRYTLAEIWLRRAFNQAGDVKTRAVLREEFATVHRDNPLSMSFGFSMAPNDNINNGSSSETITIWNLPFVLSPDARALSGIEASASIQAKYRLSRSQVQETHLGVTLYQRSYELSDAAKAAAPGVKGSDYAFAMAELSLTHDRRFSGLSGPSSLALTAGRFWYGGAVYLDYARLSASQVFNLSARTSTNLQFGYETQLSHLSGGTVSNIVSLGGGVSRKLGNGDTLSANLLVSDTRSDDPTAENRAARLQASYSFARPVMGMRLSLNLSAERRDYGVSVYDSSGRHDRTLSGGISAVFPNVSFYGFSPSVSIETSRSESNVALYDRRSNAVRLGIQSTF